MGPVAVPAAAAGRGTCAVQVRATTGGCTPGKPLLCAVWRRLVCIMAATAADA